jgi:hypothetical protein
MVESEFERPVAEWFTGDYAQIPERMQEAIRLYVLHGKRPGDFLTGVITNDLRRAVGYADAENLPLLKLYVQWFYNVAPAICSGSPAHMAQWCETQGAAAV